MEVQSNISSIQTAENGTKSVNILCCHCGTSFSVSTTGTNICLKCLSTQVDITTGITKEGTLDFCKKCERWLRPPWVRAEMESKELLDICLKKIKGLNKVKLVDANFIWTEPHSKRVKVKLTVQKEVMNNASIQQSVVIEFIVNYTQCDECKKSFTPHKWRAVVQVRQKVDHKKTFLYLEQLILKNNFHDKMLNVEEVNGGIDFFYKEKGQAIKFVEFLQGILPIRVKQSKQLISHNEQNSTYNFKFTFSIDIPRVCKDDLVALKPKLANSLGGCSKLLLCTKVASVIQFVDISNMKIVEMIGAQYFQHDEDIMIIPAKGNLIEFMVFDVEMPGSKNQNSSFINTKFKVSTASVGRVSDWENFEVKTHMGDVLNEGSSVMGYDLTSLNLTGNYDEIAQLGNLPDVILVKKVYPERKKNRKRVWKLRHLEKQEKNVNNFHKATVQKEKDDKDYDEFLFELELDADMRGQINLYKDEKAIKEMENQPKEDDDWVDVDPEQKKEDKPAKKAVKAKGKAKGKKAAKKASEDEEEEVEDDEEKKADEKEVKKGKAGEVSGIKMEELLADTQDEKTVKVGQQVGEEDEEEEDDGEDVELEEGKAVAK